jgi:hypothetical protein
MVISAQTHREWLAAQNKNSNRTKTQNHDKNLNDKTRHSDQNSESEHRSTHGQNTTGAGNATSKFTPAEGSEECRAHIPGAGSGFKSSCNSTIPGECSEACWMYIPGAGSVVPFWLNGAGAYTVWRALAETPPQGTATGQTVMHGQNQMYDRDGRPSGEIYDDDMWGNPPRTPTEAIDRIEKCLERERLQTLKKRNETLKNAENRADSHANLSSREEMRDVVMGGGDSDSDTNAAKTIGRDSDPDTNAAKTIGGDSDPDTNAAKANVHVNSREEMHEMIVGEGSDANANSDSDKTKLHLNSDSGANTNANSDKTRVYVNSRAEAPCLMGESDVGKGKDIVRIQTADVGGQTADVGGQTADVGGQTADVGKQHPALRSDGGIADMHEVCMCVHVLCVCVCTCVCVCV